MPRASNTAQVLLAKKAQDSIDELVRTATTAGVAALSPTRAAVRRALTRARTPDELRHLLLEVVYEQSAQALAKQVMRAKTMGQMAGTVAVLDELEE